MENTRKLLNDLSLEEFKTLLSVNKWLREDFAEYARDQKESFVWDVMEYFKGLDSFDYCVDEYRPYCYIHIDNAAEYPDFISACYSLNHDMCVIEKTRGNLERLNKKVGFYAACVNGYEEISDSRFNCLESWIIENIRVVSDEILNYCISEIETDDLEFFDIYLEGNGTEYTTDGRYIYPVNEIKYA